MKKHPVRKFVELKVTMPLEHAEAIATALQGMTFQDTRVRGFRRQLNAALRTTSWIGRLEREDASARR